MGAWVRRVLVTLVSGLVSGVVFGLAYPVMLAVAGISAVVTAMLQPWRRRGRDDEDLPKK